MFSSFLFCRSLTRALWLFATFWHISRKDDMFVAHFLIWRCSLDCFLFLFGLWWSLRISGHCDPESQTSHRKLRTRSSLQREREHVQASLTAFSRMLSSFLNMFTQLAASKWRQPWPEPDLTFDPHVAAIEVFRVRMLSSSCCHVSIASAGRCWDVGSIASLTTLLCYAHFLHDHLILLCSQKLQLRNTNCNFCNQVIVALTCVYISIFK